VYTVDKYANIDNELGPTQLSQRDRAAGCMGAGRQRALFIPSPVYTLPVLTGR